MKITATSHPEIVALARRAFPAYRGRTVRLEVMDHPLDCTDTSWDGGSRSQYAFVRLADRAVKGLPDLISGGFLPTSRRALDAYRQIAMPAGFACVGWSIFCGKDVGLTVILRSDAPGLWSWYVYTYGRWRAQGYQVQRGQQALADAS